MGPPGPPMAEVALSQAPVWMVVPDSPDLSGCCGLDKRGREKRCEKRGNKENDRVTTVKRYNRKKEEKEEKEEFTGQQEDNQDLDVDH